MTGDPLIISVAINGSRTRKADNPAIPYTAHEIADEIVRAAEAGAAIAHVHARMDDGSPTQDVEAFRRIVALVRERNDIILELSLGSPGFSVEEALAPLELRPEMASFPMEVRREAAAGGDALASTTRMLVERGVRPSLAVTSMETCVTVQELLERDVAGIVPCLAIAAEPFVSLASAAAKIVQLVGAFPAKAQWWLMKGGKTGADQYALRALAIGLGGHVRVGFEDMVRTYDGSALAPSNAWYVERMVQLADCMGRSTATPALARKLLRLDAEAR